MNPYKIFFWVFFKNTKGYNDLVAELLDEPEVGDIVQAHTVTMAVDPEGDIDPETTVRSHDNLLVRVAEGTIGLVISSVDGTEATEGRTRTPRIIYVLLGEKLFSCISEHFSVVQKGSRNI